jgi:FG-GAP-like repeat
MKTTFNRITGTRRHLAVCALMVVSTSTATMAQVAAGCTPSPMGTQFANVAGDGKAAAIAINGSGVTVRRSDGTRFQRHEIWVTQPYFGTDTTGKQNIYFADVNGDGKADAIVSNKTEISVRLSDGSQFMPHTLWTQDPYFGVAGGSVNNYFADVNGDGKADAIVVNASGISVRRSDGTRFQRNEEWTREPYIGGMGNYFADVTGDGKADAIVVNTNGITVRRSDGSRFLRNELWSSEPYYGGVGNSVYFADVNGDGKADAIVVNSSGITVRLSDGNRFLPGRVWVRHAYYGAIATAFVDVDGDGKADAVVVNHREISVRRSDGERFLANELWARNPYYGDLAPNCR